MSMVTRRKTAVLMSSADYSKKVLNAAPGKLIAYWMLAEPSGAALIDSSGAGRNGTATGFDRGFSGIGDGRSCPFLDGVNDYGNVYSAGLASAFNGQEGSMSLWAKVSGSGVWTDATTRRMAVLQVDANNLVRISRPNVNNQVALGYVAGGTTSQVVKSSVSTLAWMHLAITWSKSADQVKVYFNGVQEGATVTGLGLWAGSLASNVTVIGAGITTPANIWSGYLAHVAIWATPLSAAQIATLAKVG